MAAGPDPGAIYNTTLADLNQQSAWDEGKIGEQLGFQETGITRAENELSRQEPATYRTEAKGAERGGLMTSGINARRKGEIAANFGAKRGANQARLEQYRAEAKKAREGIGLKKTTGERTAAANRALQEAALTAQYPGVEPAPAAPAAPVAQAGGIRQAPGAKNIGPVGTVRVGGAQPPNLSATRYYNPITRRWETRI